MNIQTKKYLGFFVLMKGGLKTFLSTVRTPCIRELILGVFCVCLTFEI